MKITFENVDVLAMDRSKVRVSGDLVSLLYIDDLINNDLINTGINSKIFAVYDDANEKVGCAFIEKIKDSEYRIVFSRG